MAQNLPAPRIFSRHTKVPNPLWGFLHLKSESIRETDKNQRKTDKYGSIFEKEINKQLKKMMNKALKDKYLNF